jgi:hypothetical protein
LETAFLETKGLSLKNSDPGISEVNATPESNKHVVGAPAASLRMLEPGASRSDMSLKFQTPYSPSQHLPVQQLVRCIFLYFVSNVYTYVDGC